MKPRRIFPDNLRDGHAYPRTYLVDCMQSTGIMFDAVIDKWPGCNMDHFIKAYMKSQVRELIDCGHPHWITKLGLEMLDDFLEDTSYVPDYSEVNLGGLIPMWVGQVYSYYQWYYDCTSKELVEDMPPKLIGSLYYPWHEAAIHSFIEECEYPSKFKGRGQQYLQ